MTARRRAAMTDAQRAALEALEALGPTNCEALAELLDRLRDLGAAFGEWALACTEAGLSWCVVVDDPTGERLDSDGRYRVYYSAVAQ